MKQSKRLATPIDLTSMPAWRQRVEIAKDVIAALDAKVLTAMTGAYVEENVFAAGDLRKQLPGKKCNVCALGACLLAEVGRRNEFDVKLDGFNPFRMHDQDLKAFQRLAKVFDPYQLILIEEAFECGDSPQDSKLDPYEAEYATEFGKRYKSDDARLRAIMANIIANKGTFEP